MKDKQTRNTADLLVECLEEEGVHYIFGIPGEENLAVMEALKDSKSNSSRFVMNKGQPSWLMCMGVLQVMPVYAWQPLALALQI